MRMLPMVIGLVALHACVGSDEPTVGERQQDEVIDGPGEADPTGGGGGREVRTPGGGRAPPPAPPPMQGPEREDCSEFTTPSACTACCERNFDNVDTPKCKGKHDRLCWVNAISIMAACIHDCPPEPCPRCIITSGRPQRYEP
jgi:hypothetical protein